MKTILCVTDSSAETGKAIHYVKELDQLQETRLILFHTIKPNSVKIKNKPSHLELMAELEERNEYISVLENLVKDIKKEDGAAEVKYEIQIRHGLAQETIPAVVAREHVDLVVLCSEEPWQATPSGDELADELRRKTTCPVLVVPPQFGFTTGKLSALSFA